MRFRIILPVLNVIVGALLFYLGDMQVRRIMVENGGTQAEGITDVAAKAKYIDYALNAPAWALLGDTRNTLWSPSTYWNGHDLYYFIAVIVMWSLIGLAFDRTLGREDVDRVTDKTWWSRIAPWAYLGYGLFVCSSLIPRKPYSISFKNHLLTLGTAVIDGDYGWWWYLLGLAWGVGLMAVGVYSMARSRRSTA